MKFVFSVLRGCKYLIDSEPHKFLGVVFFIVCIEFFFSLIFLLLLSLSHNNILIIVKNNLANSYVFDGL